jgi:sarcosine oxidase, subunit alpha
MTMPQKLTALHNVTQKLGARYVDHLGGWHLAGGYAPVAEEIAAIRAGCGLADVSAHGKLQIEGQAAFEALAAALGEAPAAVLSGVRGPFGHLVRLRPDLFYLSTPPGRETEAAAQIEAAVARLGGFVTVTDLSQGLADLCLIGRASAQVLSQLCGLDLREAAFPNLAVRQSSVAKTRQLIRRRDFGPLPAYSLAGEQSLAAYLWGALTTAGQAHGMRPVGVEALAALEAD